MTPMTDRLRRRQKRAIIGLALLLGVSALATVGCDINHFVLFPEREVTSRPEQEGLRYETIETSNAFGRRITGWLILPEGRPKGTVLISHGNAGNVGAFLPWARALSEAGYAAALYDYQGYGESEGEGDVASLAGDGLAVVEWLKQHGHVHAGPGGRLGLLGLSLGTLVSVRLAGQVEEVSAVVLEGSLIPGEELKRKFGVLGAPVAWVLCRQIPDELDTAAQIKNVHCPVLFLHSGNDEVTSLEGARELFELANQPKRWVEAPGAAHLSPLFDWPGYRDTLVEFFNAHLAGP